jgi:hypothetical protein
MSYVQYAPGSEPAKGEVYTDSTGQHWSFVSMFRHDPKTCAPRDYVIIQIYGNYGNEVQIVELDAFHHLYAFAWGPLIECKFCGFRRMSPCAVRQTCPNLHYYPLEDDTALLREESAHV